jgi:hypothetical protein
LGGDGRGGHGGRDDHDRRERHRNDRPRPSGAGSELELERTLDDLLRELSRLPAPDVSQSVLARLGYRPIDRRTLRRRRIAALIRRVGGVTLALMVLGTGFFVVDRAQRSAALSVAIDQAVRDSVERRSELLGGVAAGLKPISELPGRLAASLAAPTEIVSSRSVEDEVGRPTTAPALARLAASPDRLPWPRFASSPEVIAESRAGASGPTAAAAGSGLRPSALPLQPAVPGARTLWPRGEPIGVPLGRPVRPAVLPNGQPLDWGEAWRSEWPVRLDAPVGADAPVGPVSALAPLKKT